MITLPAVPATLTNTLLNVYLEKGTHRLSTSCPINLKFFTVGFDTVNRGGKRNNSSIGLNACTTVYTTGKSINPPRINNIRNTSMFPPWERLTLLVFFKLIFLAAIPLPPNPFLSAPW